MSEKQTGHDFPRAIDFAAESILQRLVADLEEWLDMQGLGTFAPDHRHIRSILRKVGAPYYQEND